jgi:transcriptional regulator with XRE-family HTH domain
MDIKKELGEKIKRVRKLRNLTQEELAEMVDISPRSLSNIEVGTCFVKSETLEKIIDSLNITTEELFANDHIKTNQELICEIDKLINKAKKNTNTLEKIYRILRCIVDDV